MPELRGATIRTKISISDLFKETEDLCRAAIIVDKENAKMENKYTSQNHESKYLHEALMIFKHSMLKYQLKTSIRYATRFLLEYKIL